MTIAAASAVPWNRSRAATDRAVLPVCNRAASSARTGAAAIGHPYRVRIDFESGRYGFCEVVERAGEGMIGIQPLVPLSPLCGGM